MSDKSDIRVSGGIGFTGLLTIVFIVLRLMNIISWSWVWVLAPLWIPFALILILFLSIVGLADKKKYK